jgi:hypothetical protein
VNLFSSIGLGAITDKLRELYKQMSSDDSQEESLALMKKAARKWRNCGIIRRLLLGSFRLSLNAEVGSVVVG